MRTWLCDDAAKGDTAKLRKGRPLERLCPGVVGIADKVWNTISQKEEMIGVIFNAKNRCDCECHSSN